MLKQIKREWIRQKRIQDTCFICIALAGKVGMKLPLSNLEELDTVIKMAKTKAIQGALTDVYDFTITQDETEVTTF